MAWAGWAGKGGVMHERRIVSSIALFAFAGALFLLERRRPLRRQVDPGPRRIARNAAMAGVTAVVLHAADRPVTRRATEWVERRGWGLMPRLPMPEWLRTAATVLLFDYSLYLWHVLLHRVPLLWRCHVAHHSDLDLDTTTALRFHFAEFLLSVPWRAAQVLLIGASPRALALWQKLTAAEVVFHHSNLRLPGHVERRLSRIVVTPRLHGIHHSTVRDERDSNFSSGLTVWDFLHRSFRDDVPQEEITIGLPGYGEPREVTLGKTLLMPFVPAPRQGADAAAGRAGRPCD